MNSRGRERFVPPQGDNIIPLSSQGRSAAESFRAEHRREWLTILFTDLADSTRLQSELGNREAARLNELHRHIVREELARFDAREIEWAGDSCLAVFSKPSDGVVFALRLQAALRRARENEPRAPFVRIGLHVGEIVVRQHDDGSKREDLFGLQVSEAARVMSLARADQIYCTRSVFDNARSALKNEAIDGVGTVVWRNYGLFELKGSDEPAEICEVGEEGLAPLLPPAANDKCLPIKGDVEKWRKRRAKGKHARAGIPTWAGIAAVLLALAGGMIAGRSLSPNSSVDPVAGGVTPTVMRMSIPLPPDFVARQSLPIAISPDGSTLAFASEFARSVDGSIYVRPLSQFGNSATKLSGTLGAIGLSFSPDGEWLAYNQDGRQMKFHLATGTSEILGSSAGSSARAGAWGSDGSYLFAANDGLRLVEGDGTSRQITKVDLAKNETFHSAPAWLPGEKAIVYSIWMSGDESKSEIAYHALDSNANKILVTGGGGPNYCPTGHLVYGFAGKIWAVAFDPVVGEISGKPQAVVDGLAVGVSTSSFSFSRDGTLVYVAGGTTAARAQDQNRELVSFGLDRSLAPLNLEPAHYVFPGLSPDGQRLVASIGVRGGGRLWLFDLQRGTGFPLTIEPGSGEMPVWSPTGEWIAFRREDGLYRIRPLPNQQPKRIVEARSAFASSWSPDGRALFYTQNMGKGMEIMVVSVEDPDPVPRSVVGNSGDAVLGRNSPDGRWLTYTTNESGRQEVWVRAYPSSGEDRPLLISTEGGRDSMWSRDGKRLYFLNNQNSAMFAVSTDDDIAKWGLPEKVTDLDPLLFIPSPVVASYDVTLDDGFVFVRDLTPQTPLEIRVITNWFEELKQLVPVPEPKK